MSAAEQIATHPCARCAKVQKTCCQRAEILVTLGDVARIADHTGKHEFVARRAPADPSYLEPDEEDPEWLALTVRADGTRRVLMRRPNGDCHFLGAAGCELPETVRPLVCRLYPYAYNSRGLDGIDSEYCPTGMLAPDGRSMALVLEIAAAAAEAWRDKLYEELTDGTP